MAIRMLANAAGSTVWRLGFVNVLAIMAVGCAGHHNTDVSSKSGPASFGISFPTASPRAGSENSVQLVSHDSSSPGSSSPGSTSPGSSSSGAFAVESSAPPRVDEFEQLERWPLSLDEAVSMALGNSQVIRDVGGRVLALPNAVRTTLDPTLVHSDPNLGVDAALSAFDTRFETGLFWNGGGSPVNSAFSTGQFGVFAQPQTLAKAGFGRVLQSGTQVTLGTVGGYDSEIAGGFYAAYGAEVRHPLMRGAGREINSIAGPLAKPGMVRGVLISQIDHQQTRLEVEQAVIELIRDVSVVYWELAFAYQNVRAKQTALENARDVWAREQQRAAQHVSAPDAEALARQQYYSAEAALRNAISGTHPGQTGVYNIELRLRMLLAIPSCDNRLILPSDPPLDAPFIFDWNESECLALMQRIELRKQQAIINKRVLEFKAAKDFLRPQMDLVGTYRRLADDPSDGSDLFSEALQGWQLGVDYNRPIRNRREHAAVRNASLKLAREHAVAAEQRRQVSVELRSAFIELDRAFHVMSSMSHSRDASLVRLNAQSQRHAEGAAHLEQVLEAQIRATKAETEYRRAVVDYNLAFIKLHHSRGSLLSVMGVGFGSSDADECSFTLKSPTIYSQTDAMERLEKRTELPRAEMATAISPGNDAEYR